MIVPTLRVGMQPGTLRVPSEAERGASVEAFPRGAWERSMVIHENRVTCRAPMVAQLLSQQPVFAWLSIFTRVPQTQ
jgi:hypothetical protein